MVGPVDASADTWCCHAGCLQHQPGSTSAYTCHPSGAAGTRPLLRTPIRTTLFWLVTDSPHLCIFEAVSSRIPGVSRSRSPASPHPSAACSQSTQAQRAGSRELTEPVQSERVARVRSRDSERASPDRRYASLSECRLTLCRRQSCHRPDHRSPPLLLLCRRGRSFTSQPGGFSCPLCACSEKTLNLTKLKQCRPN